MRVTRVVRRAPAIAIGLSLTLVSLGFAGQSASVTAEQLSAGEMEAFLLKAKILSSKGAGAGVTGSQRVKLSDGKITHDAHVQTVDIAKPVFEAGQHTELNFKDSYRYNIAGYRLARLLGIDTVPMSVERNVNGKQAAVTWWVDDFQMDEKGRLRQLERLAEVKRTRSDGDVRATLGALRAAATRDDDNLMPRLVDCAKAYCTVGEMVDVLKDEWGEFQQPAVF